MQFNTMVLMLIGFIGLILLFAQLKMFQIADDVGKIREALEIEKGKD